LNCAKCEHGKRLEELRQHGDALTDRELEELRKRCMKCNPENFRHHGEIHTDLALGAGRSPFSVSRDYLAILQPSHERATPLPPATEDALLELVRRFAQMDLAAVQILHGLLNGKSCETLATELGMNSRQAVHARLKAAIRANPWLAAVHYGTRLGARTLRHQRRR